MIAAHASADEIGRAAKRLGTRSLAEDAARKAALGQTTLEEALRVTTRDLGIFETDPAGTAR
jgi:type II secretory ATPase GspE/PulE/Tfp pilus assembly ATPase PilB-like protein